MRGGTSRRRAALLAVAAVAAFAASAAVLRPAPEPAAGVARGAALPPAVRPAFVPGAPHRLGGPAHLTAWAPVRRRVAARAMPSPRARVVAVLDPRTPERTDNIVSVIRRRGDGDGRTWVRARLPALPPGVTGWIPREALGGYTVVDSLLDVDLRTLKVTLVRGGRRVLRAPAGVGMPGWDTPRGTFFIRNRLTRYRSAEYGPVAFGTSARSNRATGWPAGGFVGIHGTDHPELLPGRVSHGCIRLRDADVLALARLMPVGTPVRIH